jgi:quinolinate synthase
MTTLENLYDALLNMKNEITLDEEIRIKALKSLENMHKLGSLEAENK